MVAESRPAGIIPLDKRSRSDPLNPYVFRRTGPRTSSSQAPRASWRRGYQCWREFVPVGVRHPSPRRPHLQSRLLRPGRAFSLVGVTRPHRAGLLLGSQSGYIWSSNAAVIGIIVRNSAIFADNLKRPIIAYHSSCTRACAAKLPPNPSSPCAADASAKEACHDQRTSPRLLTLLLWWRRWRGIVTRGCSSAMPRPK